VSAAAGPVDRLRGAVGPWPRVALGLLGLLVVSLLLRSTAIHARYWIDEGLSVGIAHYPLGDIPGVLRRDGSPPLYYLLLGVWIRIFGDGEARTHALSLGFALLTIPAAFALARTLFSERAGWFAAGLTALVPFLSYYAQETRMYSLEVLLSLLLAGTFAMVFAQGRRRWMPAFVLSGTALVYTHNWGLFMLAGTGVALLPLLHSRAVAWRDALIGYGAIALLYLPWVPTLLYQAAHTGAPWSRAPSLGELPGQLASVLGGEGPGIALLLVGGAGLVLLRRTWATPRLEGRVATAIGLALLVALALAFVTSQASPAWTARYFAAMIGPLLLLAGGALARMQGLGLATMALLAALWLHPPTAKVNNKSDVHRVATLLEGRVAPGDIAVTTHPEQAPVAAFYFPKGLRWASGMGWFGDTRMFDWRDALDRYRAAKPRPTADRFVRALRPGQQLVLVLPIIRTASWNAPWTRLVRKRSKAWERLLDADARLVRIAAVPHLGDHGLPRGIRVVLYRRDAAAPRPQRRR
jgi:mannosyltransferase